jgi:uncharacterized protein YdeI (YjbR/CyaY-like superfamily)
MLPVFFKNQEEFRHWLEQNHALETELWVGYYRVETGKPSMTWSQSVDEALCFGWIDGIRQKVDNESYCIRFTPRKKNSTWSQINIAKVEELMQKGLMRPAGILAYSYCKEINSRTYSYEDSGVEWPAEFENTFKASKFAWEFFTRQSASYKRTMVKWIMSAKQKETQLRRLVKLITSSAQNARLFNQYRKPGK